MPPRLPSSWSPASASSPARGVFYGWWLVGLAVFVLTLTAVSVFQGMGTFLVALEQKFGWSRTTLSGAFSLGRLQGAVIGPVEGFLIDRLGVRRMVLIGYSVMGFGFVMLSQIHSVWQFYVSFIIITLGSGLGGWLAMMSLVNNWFVRRRSFAIATATSGVHLGGFLIPVLALGIETHGFRVTTLGIGVFLLATVLPVTRLIRDRPEQYGMRPDGDPPRPAESAAPGRSSSAGEPLTDFTVAQAVRTPAFWILTVVHLTSTISIVTLALHLVPKLTDMGQSLSAASLVVLTYTAIALPSQFIAGYVGDRMPKHLVLFVFLMFQSVSVAIIAGAETVQMAYLFAVLYGIGFGGRVPLLTTIRGDYFGRRSFATIMGLSQLPNNIVLIGAPLFAGYMFDARGSCLIPFAIFAALNFAGAILVLFVRKPSLPVRGRGPAPRRPATRRE